MDQAIVINLFENALTTILVVSLPILAIAMVVGIIVAVFQATTQINEQTMVFVPKIVAVFLGLILLGGWMLTQLSEFTHRLFEMILTYI
ncbi:MAG: flagellar biosynthesis protein FliQ [Clostridia bacterium]|nr:flagellar biosynthesis protein FliQ [Clostridia bacterium]